MRCARISLSMLVALPVLVAAASAPAASALDQRKASVAASGFYSVTFHVSLASALPSGAKLLCRAWLAPSASSFDDRQPRALPAAAGVAVITGSTATCWIEIPVAWTLNGASSNAALSGESAQNGEAFLGYEIDAVGDSGSQPVVLRTSAGQGIGVAYPSAGESARLSFNLAF